MKIALAQINTTIGDFEGTVRKVARQIECAKQEGAELIAFPELTLTGYPPRDLVEDRSFVEKNLRALEEVARLAVGIGVVVGYVARNEKEGGKPLFNAAALCVNGRVQATYWKNLLPTYDVFDEGRTFEPGRESGLWEFAGKKIGISICEDCWNLYARDPIEEQVSRGAEILLNISASPFAMGRPAFREGMVQALARRHGVPFFYVNLVGGNDELVFDGASLVAGPRGEILARGKVFSEDLLVVDSASATPSGERETGGEIGEVTEALVLGLKDYVRKCGFKKVVVGLSGGIDSSLVAVLAVKALGAKNVLGVGMPSPYSSKGSLRDAAALAKNLGLSFKKIPIGAVYASYRRLFGRKAAQSPDLADENIQARIRGNLLMALSNRHGALVLTTGNKSEFAVGYCTLYGDMSGGLAVISDLPKTLVYEVSRHLNRRRLVIPESVLQKPPSAELRPNQTDQETLPPYEVLDRILTSYVEENRSAEEIAASGLPLKTVRWVIDRIARNEYKRRQAAPGLRVTSKAFGIGRRYPIARKI